jgi:hypothetical protein
MLTVLGRESTITEFTMKKEGQISIHISVSLMNTNLSKILMLYYP